MARRSDAQRGRLKTLRDKFGGDDAWSGRDLLITNEDLQRLLRAYAPGPVPLTKIDLSVNMLGPAGAETLASFLATCPALRELNVRENTLEDQGACALASALCSNTSLTMLYMGANDITPLGARALAAMLCVNNTLQTLELNLNRLGDEGAAELAHALRHNAALRRLELGCNGVEHAGAGSLAGMLCVNKSLRELILCGNGHTPAHVRDDGAEALALALATNTTLTLLDLSNNSLCSTAALARMLHANRTLLYLNLERNDFHAAGLLELLHACEANRIVRISLTTAFEIATKVVCNSPLHAVIDVVRDDPGVVLLMAHALRCNTRVTRLRLERCKMPLDEFAVFTDMLRHSHVLSVVMLSESRIGPAGASSLANALLVNTSIRHLCLSGCQVKCEGAVALLSTLVTNTTLQILNLMSNSIDSLAFEGLHGVVGPRCTFRSLAMQHNSLLCDRDWSALAFFFVPLASVSLHTDDTGATAFYHRRLRGAFSWRPSRHQQCGQACAVILRTLMPGILRLERVPSKDGVVLVHNDPAMLEEMLEMMCVEDFEPEPPRER